MKCDNYVRIIIISGFIKDAIKIMFTEMTACSTKLCLFPQMTDFSPIQVLHVLYIIQVGTAVNTDKGNKNVLDRSQLHCTVHLTTH